MVLYLHITERKCTQHLNVNSKLMGICMAIVYVLVKETYGLLHRVRILAQNM